MNSNNNTNTEMVERTLETTYNKENADVTYDVTSKIWEAAPDNIYVDYKICMNISVLLHYLLLHRA